MVPVDGGKGFGDIVSILGLNFSSNLVPVDGGKGFGDIVSILGVLVYTSHAIRSVLSMFRSLLQTGITKSKGLRSGESNSGNDVRVIRGAKVCIHC